MPDNNKYYTEALKLKVIREFEAGVSISHLRMSLEWFFCISELYSERKLKSGFLEC